MKINKLIIFLCLVVCNSSVYSQWISDKILPVSSNLGDEFYNLDNYTLLRNPSLLSFLQKDNNIIINSYSDVSYRK